MCFITGCVHALGTLGMWTPHASLSVLVGGVQVVELPEAILARTIAGWLAMGLGHRLVKGPHHTSIQDQHSSRVGQMYEGKIGGERLLVTQQICDQSRHQGPMAPQYEAGHHHAHQQDARPHKGGHQKRDCVPQRQEHQEKSPADTQEYA